MKRESMIIYREWKDALSALPIEERCSAWEAIMDYAFDGLVPANKFLNVVTAMMRSRIDKDQENYKNTCNKRAEAGRLGGLKSGKTRAKQKEANEANASFASSNEAKGSKRKQKEATEADYDNDNDIYSLLRKHDIYSKKTLFGDNGLRIWIESICRKCNLDEDSLFDYFEEFEDEAKCRDWKIGSEYIGTRSLFFSWLTNKLQTKQNGNNNEDKLQRRRSTDSESWSEKDFEESF